MLGTMPLLAAERKRWVGRVGRKPAATLYDSGSNAVQVAVSGTAPTGETRRFREAAGQLTKIWAQLK